jgi:hypothetical protein
MMVMAAWAGAAWFLARCAPLRSIRCPIGHRILAMMVMGMGRCSVVSGALCTASRDPMPYQPLL